MSEPTMHGLHIPMSELRIVTAADPTAMYIGGIYNTKTDEAVSDEGFPEPLIGIALEQSLLNQQDASVMYFVLDPTVAADLAIRILRAVSSIDTLPPVEEAMAQAKTHTHTIKES